MKTKILILFLCFFMIKANGQIDSTSINYNQQGTVSWATMKSPSNISESSAVVFFKSVFANSNNDIDFLRYSNETDEQNFTHQKFDELYKGIKVYTGQYFAHSRNGYINVINGNFFSVNVASVVPAITESQALTSALNSVNATSYMWQNAVLETAYKQNQNDPNATYYPVGHLIIVPKDISGLSTDVLAYMFEVSCEQPLDNLIVMIDANNGNIIKKFSNVCNTNGTGPAHTAYSSTQTITSNYYPSTNQYKLETLFNNSTFKRNATQDFAGNVYINNSFDWTNWATTNPTDLVALDAHWGVTQTLDYFENKHGRSSINPANGTKGVICKVHAGNINSSKWIPVNDELHLGDGDVTLKPLASIDICAHEIGHGISIYSTQLNANANLEASAIAEALSDIWGACVKNYVNTKFSLSKKIWESGDEITQKSAPLKYVRSLSNPKIGLYMYIDNVTQTSKSMALNNLPDCYLGSNWNNMINTPTLNDGHYACGVVNKWFFLLCNGSGSFTNDAGISINAFAGIQPLSSGALDIDKAAKIIYKAETSYLVSAPSFYDLRTATIRAAIDLDGLGSPLEIAVTKAWHAVNVGPDYTPITPIACNTNGAVTLDIIQNIAYSYGSGTYLITNDTYFEKNITFNNATIFVQNGASITVSNNSTLTLNGCHLQTCFGLWKGITIEGGSNLVIDGNGNKSSLIEDAQIAVHYDASNFPQPYTTTIIDVKNTIFNRNDVGVKIENYTIDAKGQTIYPFSINNCIFTSRHIVNANGSWDNVATVRGTMPTFPATPNTYSSPYITSANYLDNATDAFLKDIYTLGYTSNTKPQAGIVLNNVGGVNSSGADASITIGNATGSNTNVFDNMGYGIKVQNSNLIVRGCTFQKPNFDAVGIYFEAGNVIDISTPTGSSNNNAFFDMKTAIVVKPIGCLVKAANKINIQNCDIRSTQNHNDLGSEKGQNGIIANADIDLETMDIANNSITNIRNAITVGVVPFYRISGGQQVFNGQINVNHNTIGKSNSVLAGATGNEFVENAITLMSSDLWNNPNVTVNAIVCYDNTITDVMNGISATSFKVCPVNILHNTIQLATNVTGQTAEQYGIYLAGGLSNNNIVEDNTVTGYSNVAKIAGISISQQSNTNIGCNKVGICQNGFKFRGANLNTKWWDNTMFNNNKYGITMDGAIIGDQGFNNIGIQVCTSNNNWSIAPSGWAAPQYMTNCINGTDAMQSKLMILYDPTKANLAKLNPDGSGESDNKLGFPPTNTDVLYRRFTPTISGGSVDGALVLVNPTNLINCPARCAGAATYPRNNNSLFEDIANGVVNVPINEAEERLLVMQQQLYELLQAQPELSQNNFDLQQFIYTNHLNSLDFIHLTGRYIEQGNTAMVNFLLSYWNGHENTLSENYHQYYEWVVAMYNDPSYMQDVAAVYAMANKCPLTDGIIIYAFRNLYNSLTERINRFEENCDGAVARGGKKQTGFIRLKQPKIKPVVKQELNNLVVYPNPANAVVNILDKNVIAIQITDVLGKTEMSINNPSLIKNVNVSSLSNGLHFIKVQKIDGSFKISKIIIQH